MLLLCIILSYCISVKGDHLQNGSPYAIGPLSVCLSVSLYVLSVCVTLVYCGQTVVWIKTKLGPEVGFVPGHIVLDGDPAPPPRKGHNPRIFGPCVLWPNGWINQLTKMPLGREVCLGPGGIVLDGDPAPSPKREHSPPIFGPCL